MKQLQQGDVWLERIDVLPEGVKEKSREDGAIVLAHGEATGHAHRIMDVDAMFYEKDGRLYLQTEKSVTIEHEEHKPIIVEPGIWEVGQVKEYDYLKDMERKVID